MSAFIQYLKLNEVKKISLRIGELREVSLVKVENGFLVAVEQFREFMNRVIKEFE